MSRMAWGCVVISFVSGSRIVERLGWSLALGWRPAEVFRFAWYRFGLFFIWRPLFPKFVDEFSVCFVDND